MSNINARNIVSENITVTNLLVNNINGVPYIANPCNDPCKKGYYVPCPDCDYTGSDNCDCGNTCDLCDEEQYTPDECDCFVPCNNGGTIGPTGPTGPPGYIGQDGATGPTGPTGVGSVILQYTSKTTGFLDSSNNVAATEFGLTGIGFTNYSAPGYSLVITPINSQNKIKTTFKAKYFTSNAANESLTLGVGRLVQGDSSYTLVARDTILGTGVGSMPLIDVYNFVFIDSPNTTLPVTYALFYQLNIPGATASTNLGIIGNSTADSAGNCIILEEYNASGVANVGNTGPTGPTGPTNSSTIDITDNNTDGIYYPTFVDGAGNNKTLYCDTTSITLNPNTDTMSIPLLNVNNLSVSRATPQIDASYNFTVVRIATDISARDITIPSPYYGQLCFLLNHNILQYYNNGVWGNINQPLASALVTGFILNTNYEIIYVGPNNNVISSPILGGYTIYRFYPTNTTTGTFTPNFSSLVEYLVIGGGGGAGTGFPGSYYGGGGGAGGYRTNYSGGGSPSLSLTDGISYNVTVGQGGVYANSDNVRGTSGINSVFDTITSSGGGGGGADGSAALSGGSGGGGSFNSTTGGTGNTGGYTPVEGYNGGNYNTGGQGAPGGGASGAGSNSSTEPTPGLQNLITGTSIIYGYGGGGAPTRVQYSTPGSGGKGGRNVIDENGANGIAGIVVVRFPSYI